MYQRPVRPLSICTRCLRRRGGRQYSSDGAAAPPSSGAARLPQRRLISLHGPDTPKFLQGLITAQVRPGSRAGFYAAFLTAPGKVLSDVFIYPTLGSRWHSEANAGDEEPGYLVEVDDRQAAGLLKHLKRHKLRSKFQLRLLDTGELDVWSVWREDERWTAHTQAESADGGLVLTDGRAPALGQRMLLAPASSASPPEEVADTEQAPESAYHLRRYLRGVAEGQTEMPWDDCLPMNCNIDIMGGIDFRKGCYLGQELTIRTHHTGVVRRRILPVMLYDPSTGAPSELEYDASWSRLAPANHVDIRRDDKRKRPTGKFVASVGNVGLAMCRLEQMSDLTVSSEASTFCADDRFIVEDSAGGELGVKAFVPSWLRGHIREPKIQRRVET